MKPTPIFILLAVMALGACGDKSAQDPVSRAPRMVKAQKVSLGDTAFAMQFPGEIRARYESTLGFRIGGKLVERQADAGTRVKAGQVLAQLDATDVRLSAQQAEANAALAAADLKRTRELRDRNFVSQAALDARESAAKAATAQAGIARNQAGYAALVADAPGVVAAVLAEPGQVVAAGQGIFRLARDGEREVALVVPETALAAIKVGTPATVALWAGQKTYAGKVREIAPAADPATRTFAIRIALNGAEAELPLGLSATVSFAGTPAAEVVVPLPALFQNGSGHAVWVITAQDTVELRPVVVARYADAGAVLASGLNAGERIVAAGAFKLTAGEAVQVVAP